MKGVNVTIYKLEKSLELLVSKLDTLPVLDIGRDDKFTLLFVNLYSPKFTLKQYVYSLCPRENRKSDFREIYDQFIKDKAKEQSSRCSQCGVPFCQVHCPLSNNIPDWFILTADGRIKEARGLLQFFHHLLLETVLQNSF